MDPQGPVFHFSPYSHVQHLDDSPIPQHLQLEAERVARGQESSTPVLTAATPAARPTRCLGRICSNVYMNMAPCLTLLSREIVRSAGVDAHAGV